MPHETDIELQNQSARIAVPIPGTDLSLSYATRRTPEYFPPRSISVPVTSADFDPDHPDLKRVESTATVAGKEYSFSRTGTGIMPGLTHEIEWDGTDGYDNPVQGGALVTGEISHAYQPPFGSARNNVERSSGGPTTVVTSSFDYPSNVEIGGDRENGIIELTSSWEMDVHTYDTTVHGFGGWTIDAHHMIFDEYRPAVEYGDGTRRSMGEKLSGVVEGYDPQCDGSSCGGGWGNVDYCAAGPDGAVYVYADAHLLRIPPEELDATSEPDVEYIGGDGDKTLEDPDIDGAHPSEVNFMGVNSIAVGPDGDVYLTTGRDEVGHAVWRVDVEAETVHVVAGTYYDSYTSDPVAYYEEMEGEPATEVKLDDPGWVDVGPEGDVYFAHYSGWPARLCRVRSNGRLALVAHPPENSDHTTNLLEDVPIRDPGDGGDWVHDPLRLARHDGAMAVGPDNEVYIGESGRIRKIDERGNISTIAGSTEESGQSATYVERGYAGDGGRATDALLGLIEDIAVDENGYIYVATAVDDHYLADSTVIRVITPDGYIYRHAGALSEFSGGTWDQDLHMLDSHPALRAHFMDIRSIDVAPDGTVYVNDRVSFIRAIKQSPLQSLSGSSDTLHLPSKDGRQIHEFDELRRHRRTKNVLTGETEREFEYDEDGLVSEITDDGGRTTTIERDEDGTATAVVSPDGTRTELEVDESGQLIGVTYPDGRTFEVDYGDGDLVESLVDPAERETSFEYDGQGRLVGVTGPAGDETNFVRTEADDGYEVTTISPEFRERSFAVDRDEEDEKTRYTNTCCDDLTTESVMEPEGDRTVTYPNGVTATVNVEDDPRFGALDDYEGEISLETPGGLEFTTHTERDVNLSDEDDVLSLWSFTETRTVNGEEHETVFDALSGTMTVTTAEGRSVELDIDQGGQPAEIDWDGLEPIDLTYEDGRLVAESDGRGGFTYEYDDGRVTAVHGPEGTVSTTYDGTGRITGMSDDDWSLGFEYDDADNVTALTTPSEQTHSLSYTAAGDLAGYESPTGDEYSLSYDGDGNVTGIDLPSGGEIDHEYDNHGRRATTNLVGANEADHGTVDVLYGTDGSADGLERTLDGETQTLSFAHDGDLLTELSFDGLAEGTFEFEYDNDLSLSSVTLPSGEELAVAHDADGLRTAFGPFTFEREGAMGAPTTITGGDVEVDIEYDEYGTVERRTHEIDGAVVYEVAFEYDEAGRVSERVETFAGKTETRTYSYESGMLTEVTLDGPVRETYEYDANENLTNRTVDGDSVETTVNDQDQIETHDGVAYSYDPDGHLVERGGDEFTYSVGGELLAADLDGSGEIVEYAYDGLGRRVARTDTDGTTEYLYGNPNNRVELTATRSPDGTFTAYYYDPDGRLIALEREDDWYYVASDQVGSPRAVFDHEGTLVKEVTYDAFGAIEADSDPSFELAIGFAGGLANPDTGLVRFWNRDYDPETGRWTARDPILFDGSLFNLYAYVANDPVNLIDPTGRCWECYWDRVGRDVDMADNPLETLFIDQGLRHFDPDLADAISDAKDVHDTVSDAGDRVQDIDRYRRFSKVWSRSKSLRRVVRLSSLPLDLAHSAGVRAGAALNPFAEHSLGETIGHELYDLIHGDDGGC